MITYSDLNMTDPTTEGKELVVDLDSIRQSIILILSTRRGERLFLPEFGNRLEDFLFEPITDSTAFSMLATLAEDVNRWEPRVSVNFGKSKITADPDAGSFDIELVVTVKGMGTNLTISGSIAA